MLEPLVKSPERTIAAFARMHAAIDRIETIAASFIMSRNPARKYLPILAKESGNRVLSRLDSDGVADLCHGEEFFGGVHGETDAAVGGGVAGNVPEMEAEIAAT